MCESESKVNPDTLGNTRTKVSSKRGHNWCFTWNNYHLCESESELFREWVNTNCEKANIGMEVGEETGTPHLQGFIKCKKNILFSTLKKVNKNISWRQCKGSEQQNFNYTNKDGDIWLSFGCDILSTLKPGEKKPIKIITELKPFQEDIEKLYHTEPDERTIHWYVDYIGGLGKTAFTKYMYVKYRILPIKGGKIADICNIIFNSNMDNVKMVIMDIPRSSKNVSYNAIESILDGMITNTKYETGISVFNAPHVVVFSNFYPDTSAMSEDRWHIVELNDKPIIDEGLDG